MSALHVLGPPKFYAAAVNMPRCISMHAGTVKVTRGSSSGMCYNHKDWTLLLLIHGGAWCAVKHVQSKAAYLLVISSVYAFMLTINLLSQDWYSSMRVMCRSMKHLSHPALHWTSFLNFLQQPLLSHAICLITWKTVESFHLAGLLGSFWSMLCGQIPVWNSIFRRGGEN